MSSFTIAAPIGAECAPALSLVVSRRGSCSIRASLTLSSSRPVSLRHAAVPRRQSPVPRKWAVADSAQSQTVSEESSEAKPEEELPSTEAAAEESAAEEVASEKGLVETIRDAFASGEEGLVAEAEAQLQGIEADRKGLADTVKALEEEIAKSKDRYLRLNADFDNFRKRSDKEKLALATNVRGEVVEALLPMVDSFERAKSSLKLETEAEQKIDSAYQGIYKQFVEVMKSIGVAAVETVGTEFDPQFHEAIMREDSTEFADGIVSQEFRKGFVIGERLLRPAMVKVSTGPGPSGAGADGADGEAEEGSSGEGSSSEES